MVSILLYGCTIWMLAKRIEEKLDMNCTRMLLAILNKSCKQYPSKHQLYDNLPPISKTIQKRRTRYARYCWRRKGENLLLWIPSHGHSSIGRPTRTYLLQLCTNTGCSLEDLPEAMDDRDEWRGRVWEIFARNMTMIYIYIYIYTCVCVCVCVCVCTISTHFSI